MVEEGALVYYFDVWIVLTMVRLGIVAEELAFFDGALAASDGKGARHESLNRCWRLAPGPSGTHQLTKHSTSLQRRQRDSFHHQPRRAVGPSDKQPEMRCPHAPRQMTQMARYNISGGNWSVCTFPWPATGRR